MISRVVVGCLTIGLVALQSCTAVLGMERATLEADETVRLESNVPCSQAPTADCSACIEQNCGTAYAVCFGNLACRSALDSYARCVGEDCDGTPGACKSKLDPSLEQCIVGCAGECTGTALATQCELYCSCMESCDGVVAGVLTGPTCVENCTTNLSRPGLVECLRTHCDFSKIDPPRHCAHATGADPVCETALNSTEPRPSPGACLGLGLRGWFCNADAECCSGDCIGTGACK
jgi:hypothetical protein